MIVRVGSSSAALRLSSKHHVEFEALIRRITTPQRVAQPARILIDAADGISNTCRCVYCATPRLLCPELVGIGAKHVDAAVPFDEICSTARRARVGGAPRFDEIRVRRRVVSWPDAIVARPGLAITFHVDGFGGRAVKRASLSLTSPPRAVLQWLSYSCSKTSTCYPQRTSCGYSRRPT